MADVVGLTEAAGSRFSSLELIGRGSFGDVYNAFDKELNKEVAIKVIDLEESEDEIEDIQKWPSAKELLKHRFIRNARKSPRLLERIRECPKYPIVEDGETPMIGKGVVEGSDTVKVRRDIRGEETVKASNQGRGGKNTGWDFRIGGVQGTGTVRTNLLPPQVRERKSENSHNQATPRRVLDGGNS